MIFNLIALQAAGDGSASQSGGVMNLLLIVALIAIFYFFMMRPQQKKQKEIRKFRDAIQKGDNIITAGGIYGKVREIKENNALVIEIAPNVKITIDKGSVYPSAVDAQTAAQQSGDAPVSK